VPIQWPAWQERAANWSFLSELVRETESQEEAKLTRIKRHDLLQRLESLSKGDRQKILITYLQTEVAQVLGMTASQIDVQQHLNTMGLDSLMSLELRNRIQTDLAVDVPIVKFIEAISIVGLATEVNGQLTQIDQNQEIEPINNARLLLTDVKDNNWIEVEL